MMNQLIGEFTGHLKQAIKIGQETKFNPAKNELKNILVCGLGGSGIGGTILSQLVKTELCLPLTVNKDYFIPEFVNQNTLVICSSYSGNTEETLMMYEQAIKKGAEVAIVTSGGKFGDLAETKGHNIIRIPGGLPPRAAFGLGFPQLFAILEKYGLIASTYVAAFKKTIHSIDLEEEQIRRDAMAIAKQLVDKIPVIYSEADYEGVCVRFRQQVNENSKRLAWHATIPEMNHNEIVGWRNSYNNLAILFFRSDADFYRNKKREEYLKKVVEQYTDCIIDINAKGDSLIERALYLIHFGDWISEHYGELNGVDTTEVDVITGLKNMLADLD